MYPFEKLGQTSCRQNKKVTTLVILKIIEFVQKSFSENRERKA